MQIQVRKINSYKNYMHVIIRLIIKISSRLGLQCITITRL